VQPKRPQNVEALARAARELRVRLGIDSQHQPNIIDALYSLKSLGFIADFVRVNDHAMPDAEARFNSRARKIFLRESTYFAAMKGEKRARWTIAHEIGHAILGHSGVRFRRSLPTNAKQRISEVRLQELEAHRFAAEFLTPAHLIDLSLIDSEGQLASLFGISTRAARIRLDELRALKAHKSSKSLSPSDNSRKSLSHHETLLATLERDHIGEYVMINTDTQEYVLAESISQVHAKFLKRFGETAPGQCVRIGASVFAAA
jgi:Zn-dependent peptidase ImmA (M78 family)